MTRNAEEDLEAIAGSELYYLCAYWIHRCQAAERLLRVSMELCFRCGNGHIDELCQKCADARAFLGDADGR